MHLSGNIFDYIIVFWSGVLVSFTPCVYPLLPLTAGFIGGLNVQGTRLRGLSISLIYVFGVAITYCLLAVIAAFSGQVFGQMQNHPLIYLIVANVLLFFALVMLDVVPLPYLGMQFQSKIKLKSLWSVLVFGMASGLVIGPCTAPILGSLLLYVASKQNLLHGVSLMFVFAYGVGASLILVGTFSGLLASMPKSGVWLVWIKQLAGLILIIAAEVFLLRAGGLM